MKKVKIKSPEIELVTVHTMADPIKAEIVKNLLADHEIQAELGGGHQAGFAGAIAMAIEIIVKESDASKARELIEEYLSRG